MSSAAEGRTARAVGDYRVLGVLGVGGMATVYLARHGDLRRLVALKELGALHAAEPINASRFLREARVAAALSHPSIVTVHDFFENEGTPYITMEYVPGGTLRPQVGGLTLAQTAGMLEGVLAGLAHAEQHGIVHRDIKPENLMVASDGHVKIADFGIAKATGALQTSSLRTATGTTIGTPNYMAPEQAMGQQVGPWTDLYSLGVVTFEMLVGRTPFYDSDSPMSIALRHVNEPIPPVRELEPDVDPAVSDWIEGLVRKDPASRPQSASDAWDRLEDAVIAALGPRWRDQSRLVPSPAPELDTAAPAAALGRLQRTATTRPRRASSRSPGGETGGATVPVAVGDGAPQRRRSPLIVLAALLLLTLIAAAAAFAGGGSGGSSQGLTISPSSSASPLSGGPSTSPPRGGPSTSASQHMGGASTGTGSPGGGPSTSAHSGGGSSTSSPRSGPRNSSSSSSTGSGGSRRDSSPEANDEHEEHEEHESNDEHESNEEGESEGESESKG